ncbi:MAG TPA: hypothetical protein VNR67_03500 [Solirubrobacterales bacterium]|nr:hypothetical protein [Solirubrobacterales bacterium]
MRHRSRHLAVLGCLVAVALAGCGGGDSTSATRAEPPPMTKAQFVEKVNDICFENGQHQAKTVEAFKRKHGYAPASVPPIPLQERMILGIVLPMVHRSVSELEELNPAPKQEAELKAFIAAFTKAAGIAERTPRWLAEPSKEYEPFMQARLLGAKMGTIFCGQA